VGIVQEQQLRLRRDQLFEIRRIEGEIALLPEVHRHRLRAAGDDLRLVDRESRVRVDHLVARPVVGGREDGVGDEGLGAGADHHVLGPDRQAAAHPRHVARRRFAQRIDAGRGRIAVLALADRPDAGFLHVHRRGKVRLADAEADDVLALAGERVDFGEYHEGVLGA
jgi:hypothetical protein